MSVISAHKVAGLLALAASPTFAVMALASALIDRGPAGAFCGTAPAGWPLDEMAMMYLLMSAFHLSPWLRLRPGRRTAEPQTIQGVE